MAGPKTSHGGSHGALGQHGANQRGMKNKMKQKEEKMRVKNINYMKG